MNKRKFTIFQRFAIWKWHEERCWLCNEPLSFKDTTVDHLFPEELLWDENKRKAILGMYGLDDSKFNIDNYENWLPSHAKCNQLKSAKTIGFMGGIAFVLESLILKAGKVKRTVEKLTRNRNNTEIFLPVLNAIENEVISFEDLIDFIKPISEKNNFQVVPNDLIILSGGYWVYRDSIAREGLCTCEKNRCVDNDEKVYCYFSPNLPVWVIRK